MTVLFESEEFTDKIFDITERLLLLTLTFNGQPIFRHKRKRGFLRLDQDEQDEFDHLVLDLTGNNQDVKNALKASVEYQLSALEDNKFEIDEFFGDYQVDHPRLNRRYLLTGAMVTNGYELKFLAYS
ncbi:hypothetical protein BGX20_003612 [Mortierella sp. AD010]|nr:hypothetical protein BGX20_003612 [Mortierella sp. AD010]